MPRAASRRRCSWPGWIARGPDAAPSARRGQHIPIPQRRRRRRERVASARLEACWPRATIRCSFRCGSRGCRRSATASAWCACPTCSPSAIRATRARCAQRWILRRSRDRCRIVAGEPAPASELRERWRDGGRRRSRPRRRGLAEFVARQAALGARARRAPPARRALQGPAPRARGHPRAARPSRVAWRVSRVSSGVASPTSRARRPRDLSRDRRHPQPLRDRPRRPSDPPALHAGLRRAAALRPRAARARSRPWASGIPSSSCRSTSRTSTISSSSTRFTRTATRRTTPPAAST